MRKQISFLVIMFAVLIFGCVNFAAAQSPGRSDADDTTKQLLEEVRALRQALQTIQRMSMDTYRSQLLVERIRADREDVRRLSSTLNDTHETLTRTQATIPQFTEQQKFLENRLQLELDQGKRTELEFEVRRTKDAIENYKAQVEPLKEREQQLTTELNSAKAKLDELQNRLDMLERGIETDRQRLDKDAPTTKIP